MRDPLTRWASRWSPATRLWTVAAAWYAATLALRLTNLDAAIRGDEAWHYFTSRHWGVDRGNVFYVDDPRPVSIAHLAWWRPFFTFGLSPFAQFGFDGWRLGLLLATSALPPLAFLSLRAADARTWASVGAAAVLWMQPELHRWTAIGFADGLMATLFLAGLWRWSLQRPVSASVLLVLSCWTKETALIGFVALACLGLVRAARRWRAGERRAALAWTLPAAAVPLAALPLAVYTLRGGKAPGWALETNPEQAPYLLLIPCLMVPLVLGLFWARTRTWSLLALGYVAFFGAYSKWGHHRIEPWYLVLPGVLALVSTWLVLDEGARRWRPTVRGLVPVVAMLFVAQAWLPGAAPGKTEVLGSSKVVERDALWEVVAEEHARDRDVDWLLRQFEGRRFATVVLVDVPWFMRYHPFPDVADRVVWGETRTLEDGRTLWNETIAGADAVVFGLGYAEFHASYFPELVEAWAGCAVGTRGRVMLVDPQAC